jgi:uncharacterized protein YcbX
LRDIAEFCLLAELTASFFFHLDPFSATSLMRSLLELLHSPVELLITATTALVVIFVAHYRVYLLCFYDRWRIAHKISNERRQAEEADDALDTSTEEDDIEVASIYIYPFKSAKACALQKMDIDELGCHNDRRLMAVRYVPNREVHRFVTQRQAPHLMTVSVTIDETNPHLVTLSSPAAGSVQVNVSPKSLRRAPQLEVGIWDDEIMMADLGDKAAKFIQQTIQMDQEDRGVDFSDARVVSILPKQPRRVWSEYLPFAAYHAGQPPKVSMADAFPILICTEESLAELNRRLKKKGKDPVPMSQFRPNLVLSGVGEAFEEDHWKVVKIGNHTSLHVVSGCPRCKMCCIDQETGEISIEPLETLGEFREFGDQDEAYFGVYAVAQQTKGCSIQVGDKVKVLLEGEPEWEE